MLSITGDVHMYMCILVSLTWLLASKYFFCLSCAVLMFLEAFWLYIFDSDVQQLFHISSSLEHANL